MFLKHHYPFPTPQGLFPPVIRGWSEGGGKICKCSCAKGLQAAEKRPALATGEVQAAPSLLPYMSSAFQTVSCLAKFSCQREGVIKPASQVLGVASIPSSHFPPIWKLRD